jgi:hypothetical protein
MTQSDRFNKYANMALSRAVYSKNGERDALLSLAGIWVDAATKADDAVLFRSSTDSGGARKSE